MKYLLDTHVLLHWLEGGKRLSRAQKRVIDGATGDRPLLVSDVTLWEIATLYELRRIQLALPLRDWLDAAVAPPLVERVGISPAIAAETAVLPPTFHRDPADRILVATARVLGASLLTVDARIVESRIVKTVE
ncbi:MAG TPA: type II toxin-antitoxin system VapC family toxin [Polyangiaceae bacterium]